MNNDWYGAAIDHVHEAAEGLTEAVNTAVAALRDSQERLSAGLPLAEIVAALAPPGGRTARSAPATAFRRYERAMSAYRARCVRSLVDDEGRTFSEIGTLLGVSRQMVARLYRQGLT